MKKHIIISMVFVAVMAVASVIPLEYHFSQKEVAKLSGHHTYEEVLLVELPAKLAALAEKKQCRDYVIPVKTLTGDADALPDLVDDINLGLQAFSGWKLCVDEALKQKMIKRVNERFKIWGAMGVGSEMIHLSQTQKNVAMKTNYSAVAKVTRITSSRGDDIKLVISVNDETEQARLFEIPVTFIHPLTLAKLKADREKKLAKIAALKKRAEMSCYALAFVALIYLLYLLTLAVLNLIQRRHKKTFKNFIANEIEKREDLINDGHFVTALELSDRYLKHFPYDTAIKAFRTRLLDYTNNDPEKAQQAYVEWKKLQSRMKDSGYAGGASLLSQDEKKNIALLLPYHPELKTSYNQILLADEQAEKKEYETALKYYDSALMSLNEGKIKETGDKLREIFVGNPGFKKAVELNNRLTKTAFNKITLRQKKGNSATLAEFFFKEKILLGRNDVDNMPDIAFEDRRVSRRHLCIEFKDGAFMVSDLESAGGTFVNGDKIQTAMLAEGDLLTISKVIDYDVSLYRNGNGCSGIILKGKDRNFFIVRGKIAFDIAASGEKIKLPGNMVSVSLSDGVIVLSTDKDTIIPAEGDEIRVGDDVLIVEVTN